MVQNILQRTRHLPTTIQPNMSTVPRLRNLGLRCPSQRTVSLCGWGLCLSINQSINQSIYVIMPQELLRIIPDRLLEYKLVTGGLGLEDCLHWASHIIRRNHCWRNRWKGTVKTITGFTSSFIPLFGKPLLSTHMCPCARHDVTWWTQPNLVPALKGLPD